jgi:sugar phosphate isomerase/epimerase
MRRRNLIRALAGGTAAGFLGGGPFAEAQSGAGRGPSTQSRKPLLGFSYYGMKRIPVREAINHIAKIGYKGLELTLIPSWETEPKLLSKTKQAEIRKQIGDLGLTLSSVQESLQLAEPNAMTKLGYNISYSQAENLERLRVAAELAHELSPGAPAVIETQVGGRAGAWEESKRGMADRLGEWAKALEPLKAVLAIKGFVGTAMDTPDKMLWMLDQVKNSWIRIGYDYSHLKLLGLDMRETIRQVGSRSAFIHVKDSVGTQEKFRFLLPGDSGEINYKEYAQTLGEVGYVGPVMVEVSAHVSEQPGYDAVAAAKRSWDNLSPFFA